MSDKARTAQLAESAAGRNGFAVDIRKVLKDGLGCTNLLPDSWYENILVWASWYAGATEFHKYRIFNGRTFVPCMRKTLGMAKKMSEDKADLLLNEKVEISVSRASATSDDGVLQGKLDSVLHRNSFRVLGNQLIEIANALGTGAIVEYKDDDTVGIDYIPATMIFPLSWSKRGVVDCAFASATTINAKTKRLYISRHIKESGQYVVYNNLFDITRNGKYTPVELPGNVLERWETGSDAPCFQFITPAIVNNIDLSNPMGVSIFANSIDLLEAADLAFDSFINEFKLGKKRIFVDGTLLNINPTEAQAADGDPFLPLFDISDTAFYALPFRDGTAGNGKPIEESNMELRINDHRLGLQTFLDMLSEKAGFGKGYYRFDVDAMQTATAVVSANSKLYRNIRKDGLVVEKALIDMTLAIMRILGITDELDIGVAFDDSIIEDTDAIAKRAMVEYNLGLIDAVEYFVRVYKMTEETAAKFILEMDARKPAATVTEDEAFSPGV